MGFEVECIDSYLINSRCWVIEKGGRGGEGLGRLEKVSLGFIRR